MSTPTSWACADQDQQADDHTKDQDDLIYRTKRRSWPPSSGTWPKAGHAKEPTGVLLRYPLPWRVRSESPPLLDVAKILTGVLQTPSEA